LCGAGGGGDGLGAQAGRDPRTAGPVGGPPWMVSVIPWLGRAVGLVAQPHGRLIP
jgi:hypothetical protein